MELENSKNWITIYISHNFPRPFTHKSICNNMGVFFPDQCGNHNFSFLNCCLFVLPSKRIHRKRSGESMVTLASTFQGMESKYHRIYFVDSLSISHAHQHTRWRVLLPSIGQMGKPSRYSPRSRKIWSTIRTVFLMAFAPGRIELGCVIWECL